MDEIEIWKDVPGYEGLYQVSTFGRVRSYDKEWDFNGSIVKKKGGIINPKECSGGYLRLYLSKNNVKEDFKVHRLVWETFNHKTDLHIDHKVEGNKKDNRLSNLQAVSKRYNTAKYHLNRAKTSKYTGVNWDKVRKKWKAGIYINGTIKHLGYHINEEMAANAYQQELLKII